MQSKRIGEQISILKNVRELIASRKLPVTDTLLNLLDKVGVNLQGYGKGNQVQTVPNTLEKNKEMVLNKEAA